jgi:hypothetical protein
LLTLVDGAPTSQLFTATLTYGDGSTRDVTSETAFEIDSLGTFAANQLDVVTAGRAEALAHWNDRMAAADVVVRLVEVRVDPSLPPNTPDLFQGVESSAFAPTVLYPPDQVAMPRNLGDFEVHWTGGGLDAFEVSLETDYSAVRVYVRGGNGQPSAGTNASWAELEASEWTAATADANTAGFQVRGISYASPGTVYAAPRREIQLSREPMQGGIYYWASTATQGSASGIFRHDMADAGLPATEFWTTDQTDGHCIGCHAISRDGSRMAATYNGGNGTGTVIDIATSVAEPVTNNWNFATFTPDGRQVLTIHGYALTVRDAATQAVLAAMTETPVTHPELSPDGKQLVYVRPTTLAWDWMFGGGQIYTRSYDQATQTFGPEHALVTTGANNYYPSWSPDGQWIVFNRSDDGTGTGAYDNASASVWVVRADGSMPPVELTAANQGVGLTNSWARFAPFEQTAGNTAERIFWVTVSSKRDFGTRLQNTGMAENQKVPQLWMTAFYPDRVAAVPDPSTPAFRLPFQSLATHNHAAQWTEQVIVIQ